MLDGLSREAVASVIIEREEGRINTLVACWKLGGLPVREFLRMRRKLLEESLGAEKPPLLTTAQVRAALALPISSSFFRLPSGQSPTTRTLAEAPGSGQSNP